MASANFIVFVLAVLLLGLSEKSQAADTCAAQLDKLVSCAPSVVPGSTTPPTQQCCSALKAMTHDCSCETIKIINSLPTKCGLSAVKCNSMLLLGLSERSNKATDTCVTQLDKLVSCAPSAVPGSTIPPTRQCCSALKAMTHDCSCETIKIINSLPAKCGISPVKCTTAKSS